MACLRYEVFEQAIMNGVEIIGIDEYWLCVVGLSLYQSWVRFAHNQSPITIRQLSGSSFE